MTTTPETPSSASTAATDRVITATALALNLPDAGIRDYPEYGQTSVVIDLDGIAGTLIVLDEGTVTLSVAGVPLHVAQAFLDAITAQQGGTLR